MFGREQDIGRLGVAEVLGLLPARPTHRGVGHWHHSGLVRQPRALHVQVHSFSSHAFGSVCYKIVCTINYPGLFSNWPEPLKTHYFGCAYGFFLADDDSKMVYVLYSGEVDGEGWSLPCLPLLIGICSVLRWGGRLRMVVASPPSPPPTWRTSLESNIFCTGRSVQYWAWIKLKTYVLCFLNAFSP